MRVTGRYGVEVAEAAQASGESDARADAGRRDGDSAMIGRRVGEEWARKAGSDVTFDRRQQTAR